MSTPSNPISGDNQEQAAVVVSVDETLVEQIWQEVQGKVSRLQVRQLVVEATSDFAEATITTYVSIFVRRQVHEKLAFMLVDVESTSVRQLLFLASEEAANGEGESATKRDRSGRGFMIWLFQNIP